MAKGEVTKSRRTPTQRTLAWLRREGWTCQVVERWNAFARRRIDLFGGIDIVAVKGVITLGVQCTTQANAAARVTKLKQVPAIEAWLAAGNRLEVWGWAKRGARGQRKVWSASVTPVEMVSV